MGLLTKIVLFYCLMAICATLYAPEAVFGSDYNGTILSFFSVNSYNYSTGEVVINQHVTLSPQLNTQLNADQSVNETQGVFSQITSGVSSIFNWIVDGLANVLGFFRVVFKVLFSPVILLFSPAAAGIPKIVGLFLGIPLVLMMIFAIVAFIRGVQNP